MKWYENPAELTKRRQEVGLSQAELAKRIGRSRSLIRDVELGKVKLRGELAEQLWTEISNTKTAISGRMSSLADLRWSSPPNELHRLREQNRIFQELVTAYKAALEDWRSFCRELMNEANIKDTRIIELEKKVADLREMYDVGTQVTVATARFEELREKVMAAAQNEAKGYKED